MDRLEVILRARELDALELQSVMESAGPGRWEGCQDRELGGALEILSLAGYTDDVVQLPAGGYVDRLDRFTLWVDEQGFRSVIVFKYVQDAERELERMVADVF